MGVARTQAPAHVPAHTTPTNSSSHERHCVSTLPPRLLPPTAGNGTRACVSNTAPSVLRVPFTTPLSEGVHVYHTFRPWFDADDDDNILFASVQGYGPKSNHRPGVCVKCAAALGLLTHTSMEAGSCAQLPTQQHTAVPAGATVLDPPLHAHTDDDVCRLPAPPQMCTCTPGQAPRVTPRSCATSRQRPSTRRLMLQQASRTPTAAQPARTSARSRQLMTPCTAPAGCVCAQRVRAPLFFHAQSAGVPASARVCQCAVRRPRCPHTRLPRCGAPPRPGAGGPQPRVPQQRRGRPAAAGPAPD